MKSPERLVVDLVRLGLDHASRVIQRALPGEPGDRRSLSESPASVEPSFRTEAEMLPQLRAAATALWVDAAPRETWVLLEEQLLHNRIADLVLVRVDVEAVRARLEGGWLRPLRLNELRVLNALRPDRPASVRAVAQRVRVEPASVAKILRRLAGDGFIAREAAGGYRRLATVRAIAQRVISFEAKREDPRGALLQARGHRAWADETYIACDARYTERFDALREQCIRVGVGLFEVSPTGWRRVLHSHPRRRSNRLEASLIGEGALARLLGAPAMDRPERRLPHGHRLSAESEPIVEGHRASWLSGLRGALQ
jgi:DNA-binding MarR family transcriptional regulator